MIIELVGLPGSGKTTFAREIEKAGKWKIVKVSGKIELILLNLYFLLRHPLSFFAQLSWLVRYAGNRAFWYTKFMNLFLVHNAKYMKADRYAHAIIDQGHHQNIISLFESTLSKDALFTYRETLPVPDALFVFNIPEEVRGERLKQRGYSTRDDINDEKKKAWVKAREANFGAFVASLEELPFTAKEITTESTDEVTKQMDTFRTLLFIMHARMPTEKAHGLQIAKTLESLIELKQPAILWVPDRQNTITKSIDEYYGLRVHIPVQKINSFSVLRFARSLGSLAHRLDSLFFMLSLLCSRISRSTVVYTRSPEIVWLMKRKQVSRVVLEAHSWPNSHERIFEYFSRSADVVVANSDGTAEEFKKRGFPKVEVLRNGVDLESFKQPISKERAREMLSLPQDKQIVMYVGAFYAWKGVPLLLESWNKHFSSVNDKMLVLVGGTKEDAIKNGGAVKESVDNIIFVPHVPAGQVPHYLFAADMLVLPNAPVSEESMRFTSPIKLFEYMASGKPIIASDLPSIREILDEHNALFFEAGNAEDLSVSIKKLSSDGDLVQYLSSNTRVLISDYSWQTRSAKLQDILRSDIAKNT